MEMLVTAALLCWLVHTMYSSVLLIRDGKSPAEGNVCIYMGNQAEVAEWFIRSVCRSEGFLAGRLELAVVLECPEDETFNIVKILSREKSFPLIAPGEWQGINRGNNLRAGSIDIRGMNNWELLKGPLNSLMMYGRQL